MKNLNSPFLAAAATQESDSFWRHPFRSGFCLDGVFFGLRFLQSRLKIWAFCPTIKLEGTCIVADELGVE